YLDGVADATSPNLGAFFYFNTSPAVGIRSDTLQNGFLGSIDDLSVYDHPLTAAEIQTAFNTGTAGKCVTPAPPGIGSLSFSPAIAVGNTVGLRVLATGYGPLTYQWQLNGTNIGGATNKLYTHPNAQPADGGAYAVVV